MTNDQLIADLRARLAEAEETLRAIREGEVDAVVVSGSKGDRVFALTESESLPRLMVETMNEAGLAVTPDGLLVFANDRAAGLLGRPKAQLLGHNLGEFIAPSDAGRFRQLLQTAVPVDARLDFLGAAGAPFPMHVWATRLDRPDNPLVCLVATDITRVEADRKLIAQLEGQQAQLRASRVSALNLMKDAVAARQQAEQANAALQTSEQRIQQALQVSRSFTFDWYPATDTVLRSASCGLILGLTGDEAVNDTGQQFFQRVHPADRARFVQLLHDLTPTAATYTVEYRVAGGDGRTAVLEEVGQGSFDAAGKLERLVGVSTDITERRWAESVLRESAERLAVATESARVGMWATDIPSGTWDFAPQAARVFGLPDDGPVSIERVLELTHPDDRKRLSEQSALALAGAGEHEFEYRIVRPDGELRWVLLRGRTDLDAAGRPWRNMGIAMDITARKRVEEDLARTRDILTESQRIAHLGSFEYVTDTRTTVWSEEEFRIYGLDPASPSPTYEVMLAKHIHSDDAALLHETFAKALQSGSVYELEHRIVRPDGSVRVVYDRAHPYFDEKGKLVRYVGATLDVTERKAVEQALRESEARFRLALKNSPVLVAMQDRDLVYRWAYNTRTRRAEDVIGKTDADLFAPEDLPSILEAKRGVLQTGEEVRQAYWLTSNGQRVFLDCFYEPVRDSVGNVIGVGIAAVNLTEQKRAEEALERSEALLRAVLDNCPDAIFMKNREGRLQMVNPATCAVVGKPADELIGKTDVEAFADPAVGRPIMENDRRIMESGETQVVEETAPGPEGPRVFLSTKAAYRDAQGQIVGVVGVASDITERKQAEERSGLACARRKCC